MRLLEKQSNLRRGHAPDAEVELLRRGLHWSDDERRALEAILGVFGEQIYFKSILQELASNDVQLTPAQLSEVRAAWVTLAREHLRDIARAHAGAIVRTYNGLVDGIVEHAVEAAPGAAAADLLATLEQEQRRIWDWKSDQVQETERFAFYQAGFEEFYQRNTEYAALFEFGGSLICEICQDIAADNPYTFPDMQAVDDPPHIGCLDIWVPAA